MSDTPIQTLPYIIGFVTGAALAEFSSVHGLEGFIFDVVSLAVVWCCVGVAFRLPKVLGFK